MFHKFHATVGEVHVKIVECLRSPDVSSPPSMKVRMWSCVPQYRRRKNAAAWVAKNHAGSQGIDGVPSRLPTLLLGWNVRRNPSKMVGSSMMRSIFNQIRTSPSRSEGNFQISSCRCFHNSSPKPIWRWKLQNARVAYKIHWQIWTHKTKKNKRPSKFRFWKPLETELWPNGVVHHNSLSLSVVWHANTRCGFKAEDVCEKIVVTWQGRTHCYSITGKKTTKLSERVIHAPVFQAAASQRTENIHSKCTSVFT